MEEKSVGLSMRGSDALTANDAVSVHYQVSFLEAFRYWLKVGFVNFGGPAGQIALMHRDLGSGAFPFTLSVAQLVVPFARWKTDMSRRVDLGR